ncbi:MAG: ATP-binding protein, partial [Sedimenticolaceae bacterium]
QGHSALFINAAQMLGDLAAQDGDNALRRRFAHYARPDVLVIEEIGYLSYGTRHADMLFEIVNRRYERKPTIITTNRLCGAPHNRFNAAHIVMRTLVPERLAFALF